MDLYATESQAFWRITFPLVFPGILGAALLSFSLSFDDFIITNLNAGNTTTFPMYVWGVAQRGVPMQVNVDRHADVPDRDRDRGRRASIEPAAAGEGARVTSPRDSAAASLRDAPPLGVLARRPGPARAAARAGRARLGRPGRRGRWLPRALDRAAGQGARPRARRACCSRRRRCGHAASGRNGGFCEASLTHGFGNGLAALARRARRPDRAGRENLDGIERHGRRARHRLRLRRAGSLAVATAPHQVEGLREEYERDCVPTG